MAEVLTERNDKEAVVNWKMTWLVSAGFSVGVATVIAQDENMNWRLAMECLPHAKRKGFDEAFVLELLS